MRINKILSGLIFVLMLGLVQCFATTYFVATAGSDSADGVTSSTPWAHYPGMTGCSGTCGSTTLLSGDTVKFNCGDTWRGATNTSEVAGVTLTSYGSCTGSNKPKLTASTALTNASFTLSSGKTFTYQIALTTNPGHYSAESGSPLLFQSSIAAVEANACSFWWSANVYYVHACDSSVVTSNGKVYETSTGFDVVTAKSNMTIDGLDLEFGTSFVINAGGATGFTLTNSKLAYGGGSQCVWVDSGPAKSSNQTYTNNDISYCDNAVFLYGDNLVITGNTFHDAVRCTEIQDVSPFSQNILISGNNYHDCGAGQGYPASGETNAGILVNGSVHGTNSNFNQGLITQNYFQNMHGRPYDGFMGNSTISYNVMVNTLAGSSIGDAICIDTNGPNVNIFNNTCLNFANMGVQVETTPVSGNAPSHVENNIFSNQQPTGTNWLAYVSNAAAPPVFKNNTYYESFGANPSKFSWQGVVSTFSGWQTNSGSTGEQFTDPKFTSNTNPRLLPASLAINAGLNLGASYQSGLNPASSFPFSTLTQGTLWDEGAFLTSGSSPSTMVISNISVSASTATTATITWTTSSAATSQVIYGLNGTTSQSSQTNQNLVTSHSLVVSGLVAGQVYTYKVVSIDTNGSQTSSANTFQLCSGSGPTNGYTNVTGTVGVAYAQGQMSAVWVNDSGVSTTTPTVCGATFPTTITSILTTTGNLNVQLPDNNIVIPSPGRWRMTISNATGNVGQFNITTAITGQSIGLTSQLQAASSGQLQLIYYDPATGTFDPPITSSGGGGGSTQSVSVLPLSFDFSQVQVGQNSDTRNLVFSNTGTLPVTLTFQSFSNTKFNSTASTSCNGILGPGAVCNFPLRFSPTIAQAETGALVFTTDIAASPTRTISLTGVGTAVATYPVNVTATDAGLGTVVSTETPTPNISCTIAPPALPAGRCSANYPSGTTVTLIATPGAASTFSSFNGATCSTSPCSFSVASPGFTIVADFALNSPIQTPSVVVTPPSIPYGTVQTGTSSTVSVTIANASPTLPLTVNSVVFSDTHFTSPSIHLCDGVIKVAGVCVLDVTYTPTAGVTTTGTLTVNTNAPVNPQGPFPVVALSGTGSATASFLVSLVGFGTGNGTVSDGGSLSCHFTAGVPDAGNTCQLNYTSGSSVTLTATADVGSTFSTFAGASCTTSPCTVTVSAAALVTATFNLTIPSFILSIAGLGQGNLTVTSNTGGINCTSTAGVLTGTCSASYLQGASVILTESPLNSSTFTSWGGAPGCSTSSTCTVTVSANTTVTASAAAAAAGAPLQLVQTIPGGTGGTNNITGTLASATSAGDLYVVYAGWSDATTTVSSITDTKGNTYTQFTGCAGASSPRTIAGLTEVAYYAQNVAVAAAGANTITIALSATPTTRQMFVLHYTGVTATPFDVCAGATGTGTAVSSGNLTTSVAGDVVTAAAFVANHITVVGSGFTQQISASGNDAEDKQSVATGTYANAPTQSNATNWIDIAGAFKASGGGAATQFTVNTLCGSGSGTVAASGISLTCTNGVPTGTGSTTVAANGTLTFVATPAIGFSFVNYNGAGCSASPTCVSSAITTNTTVTVNFAAAGGQNFYINGSTGNNSNSGLCAVAGTPAGCSGPWATLAKANSAVINGSVGVCSESWISVSGISSCIHVASGNYNESPTYTISGTSTQGIMMVSSTRNGAVITGTGGTTMTPANFFEIDGFGVTNTSAKFAFLLQSGNNRKIQYSYIHDMNNVACSSSDKNGIIHETTAPADSDVINGNVIRHFGGPGCANLATFHGIYADGSRLQVTNNIISGGTGGWAIQKQYAGITNCAPGTISNNTIFNNQGGIILNDEGNACAIRNWTIVNNVIVNNGVSGTGGGGGNSFGIDYWNFTGNGTTLVSNNTVYGNLPANFGNHGSACTAGALTTNCPAINTKTDASTSVTFASFQSDTNSSPAAGYNAQNYLPGAASSLLNNGITTCATGGLVPCVPPFDFNIVARPQRAGYDIGAFELP